METVTSTDVKLTTKGAAILISDFNFDLDGDGTMDEFEKKVLQSLKAADTDGSGSLTPAEMITVFRGMAATEKSNKQLGKMVGYLMGLVVLLVAALVGVSVAGAIIGGESIKESTIPDCRDPSSDSRCDPAKLTKVGTVESFSSIFELPKMPTEQLAYLRDITMYIDMAKDADIAGPAEATFKVAGAYKRTSTKAYLRTVSGATIMLDSASETGSIKMDGNTYPISTTAPSNGRRLETTPEAPMIETKTGYQLAHDHRRRRLDFQGSLMTSGSFTMVAGGGFN